MSNDLFVLTYMALIFLILGFGLFWLGMKDIRVSVILFLLTPVITSIFYKNEERWLTEELETGFEGYIRGGIIIFCALIGIATYIRTWGSHKGKLSLGYLFIFLFLILAFTSISYTADIKYTTIRSIFFLALFLYMIGIDKWLDDLNKAELLLNSIFYVAAFFIIISLFSLAIPARSWWWRTPRFIGLLSEPNITGAFFMLSYPILLWKYYNLNENTNKKRIVIVLLLIALFLHILTGSRTTIISSILGISIFLFIQRKTVKLVSVLGIVSLIVIIVFFIYTPENLERGDEGTMLTVTGRDVLWQGAIFRFFQRPFFGWGYMVESKILTMRSMQGSFSLASAQQPLHNGYLSILTGTGLVGFIIWLTIISYPFIKNAKLRFPELINYKSYFVSTFIMVLVSNFTESFLTGYIGNGGDLFFWFAWVISLKLPTIINSKNLNDFDLNKSNPNLKIANE